MLQGYAFEVLGGASFTVEGFRACLASWCPGLSIERRFGVRVCGSIWTSLPVPDLLTLSLLFFRSSFAQAGGLQISQPKHSSDLWTRSVPQRNLRRWDTTCRRSSLRRGRKSLCSQWEADALYLTRSSKRVPWTACGSSARYCALLARVDWCLPFGKTTSSPFASCTPAMLWRQPATLNGQTETSTLKAEPRMDPKT